MDYDFNLFNKYKIKPTKIIKGRRKMKNTQTLLKDIYNKKIKLIRKCKKIIQNGGSKNKIDKIETEISEIETLHKNIKNLLILNTGIIETYSNSE